MFSQGWQKSFIVNMNLFKRIAPGEARTHNLGLAQHISVYKIRALADCATGAVERHGKNF